MKKISFILALTLVFMYVFAPFVSAKVNKVRYDDSDWAVPDFLDTPTEYKGEKVVHVYRYGKKDILRTIEYYSEKGFFEKYRDLSDKYCIDEIIDTISKFYGQHINAIHLAIKLIGSFESDIRLKKLDFWTRALEGVLNGEVSYIRLVETKPKDNSDYHKANNIYIETVR